MDELKYPTLKDLMVAWKQKRGEIKYTDDQKVERILKIDHAKDYFIEDGIIDEAVWKSLPYNKRILFVLKEGYHDNKNESFALHEQLNKWGPWGKIWERVCYWTHGIINTDEHKIAIYQEKINEPLNSLLHNIAVLNIKKSNGQHESDWSEIAAYARFDREEILKEIELIDPYIVVCGYTLYALDGIVDNKIREPRNENWFYYSDAIGHKERLFIDYFHPSNRFPDLLNYYGLMSIYQQALLSRK